MQQLAPASRPSERTGAHGASPGIAGNVGLALLALVELTRKRNHSVLWMGNRSLTEVYASIEFIV